MISWITYADGLFFNSDNIKHAKSVCNPSSRLISSLLNVKPGILPLFFNQKIEANAPLKNIPSTQAKATRRSPKVLSLSEIHFNAQSDFFLIDGTVSMALNNLCFSSLSLMYVSINKEYTSLYPVNIPLNIPLCSLGSVKQYVSLYLPVQITDYTLISL